MATYLHSVLYDDIVSAIIALGHTQDEAKIALGEQADVWPDRIAADALRTLQMELQARQCRQRVTPTA